MKILFFFVLLSNIVFFLWEFNSVEKITQTPTPNNQQKQILLISEIEKKIVKEERIILTDNEQLDVLPYDTSHYKKALIPVVVKPENILLTSSEGVNEGEIKLPNVVSDSEVGISGVKEPLVEQDSVIDSKEIDRPLSIVSKEIAVDENARITEVKKQDDICYQVGPFINEKIVDDWIRVNNINLAVVTKANKEVKLVTGFLVYYPKAETYEASNQHVKLLQDMDITDFWLFRKGELKGHISLGLFIKESRSQILQQKMIALGLNAEVMTRYKTETEWFAEILSQNKLSTEMMIKIEKLGYSVCANI